MNDLPDLISVNKALYEDDLLIWTTEKYPVLTRSKLNRALTTISTYSKLWKMEINKEKSVYSIFSHSNKTAKRNYILKIDSQPINKEENPTYLGVKLDQRLSLKHFMADLKEKASQRLNIIKHLAGTSWGAEKKTLRQLYTGYVRSVMDNCLSIQVAANKTYQSSLDTIQNQALRLISGGMRTTPTAACEIDSNIEPLKLRRNRAALEAIERYRRLEDDHPNKLLTQSNRKNNQKKQRTLIQLTDELALKHHLPNNREKITRFSNITPGLNYKQPTIKTHLLNNTLTKESNPLELKAGTLETIESYQKTAIHIYTDGSAFKATINAGLGAFLVFPKNKHFEISAPCGDYCSNFQAEIEAITIALQTVENKLYEGVQPPSDIVVFTDSQSTLQALNSSTSNSPRELTTLIVIIHQMISKLNINITLQLIPGHIGIMGNEKADKLSKAGSTMEQPDRPVNYLTLRSMLVNNHKEEWLNQWASGNTGRAMYREMTTPNKLDSINFLPAKNNLQSPN
ncbi:uncharacterized protein LOC129921966 [Biomphalaria glabrata]|uniref:Uncharacterized protein LOC129921966 n=1 Tax=Biomphalaria glabrata TaxID=6526 RepID=A0A9W2YF69_BIOGL|nr:uncharacterized protein LOC129921966 [Biomphalaria glabrata]